MSSVSARAQRRGGVLSAHIARVRKTSAALVAASLAASLLVSFSSEDVAFAQEQPAPAGPAPEAPAPEINWQAEADGLLAAPMPEKVDELLDFVGKVSRAAEATNQQVLKTEETLEAARGRAEEANASLAEAENNLNEVRERLAAVQEDVAKVSLAKYTGVAFDSATAVMGASGPQAAIQRSAYLALLSDKTKRTLESIDRDMAAREAARNAVERAREESEGAIAAAESEKVVLDERNEKLEGLKRKVMNAVDGLNRQDRQRWVDRNGPIEVDIDEFLGRIQPTQSAPVGDAGPSSVDTSSVVAAALSRVGSSYGWGSTGPNQFDCSGLMVWSFKQLGKTIPRTSQAQIAGGTPVSRANIQPGDIVGYFSGISHVGMYIGDGKIVHSSDYGVPVQVVPLDSMPIAGIVRY